MRRRVLCEHHFLAAQVGHGLDRLAGHDAVAAVRPVDLLVDTRHDAAIARLAGFVDKAFHEQRHHVERGPADVHVAGRVGVAHGDRIVDQHQLDFEFFALGRLPNLAGLEAVVGQNDRPPAGPHVQCELHGVVFERLVGRSALHFRQAFGRAEGVLLHRRHRGRIGIFRRLAQARPGRCRRRPVPLDLRLSGRTHRCGTRQTPTGRPRPETAPSKTEFSVVRSSFISLGIIGRIATKNTKSHKKKSS